MWLFDRQQMIIQFSIYFNAYDRCFSFVLLKSVCIGEFSLFSASSVSLLNMSIIVPTEVHRAYGFRERLIKTRG